MKSILKKLLPRPTRHDTWSVVSTVKEPLSLLRAYVAHHLDAGAETIYLYFDDPLDTGFEHFFGQDRVNAKLCDDEYWKKRKRGRPSDHRARQTFNATRAYQNCTSNWIAHCDADEFLVSQKNIGVQLGEIDENIQVVRVPTVERTFEQAYDDDTLEIGGSFKRKSNKYADIGRLLFGDAGIGFRYGFQGHHAGKVFSRTGQKDRRVNIHGVSDPGQKLQTHRLSDKEICLAHHFPLSFEDWLHKFSRRTLNEDYFKSIPAARKQRYKVYQETLQSGDVNRMRKLFEFFSVLNTEQISVLNKRNLLKQIDLDIERKVTELLPDIKSTSGGLKQDVETSAGSAAPKVFQIGMCNCGTRDLCRQFELRHLKYVNFDEGQIAATIDNSTNLKEALDSAYGGVSLFANIVASSGELFPDPDRIGKISEALPEAIFVLNMRSPQAWDRSLQRKIGEQKQSRIEDWRLHRSAVRQLFADSPERLIEINIDKAKPGYLFDTLDQRGIAWSQK